MCALRHTSSSTTAARARLRAAASHEKSLGTAAMSSTAAMSKSSRLRAGSISEVASAPAAAQPGTSGCSDTRWSTTGAISASRP